MFYKSPTSSIFEKKKTISIIPIRFSSIYSNIFIYHIWILLITLESRMRSRVKKYFKAVLIGRVKFETPSFFTTYSTWPRVKNVIHMSTYIYATSFSNFLLTLSHYHISITTSLTPPYLLFTQYWDLNETCAVLQYMKQKKVF